MPPPTPTLPTDRYPTRKTLIEQVQDPDDHQAWETFFETYKPYIHTVIRSMHISPADCEELTQQVIIKLWEQVPKLNYDRHAKRKFRSWLFKVIKHHVIDYKRQRSLRAQKLERYQQEEAFAYLSRIHLPDIDQVAQKEWENHLTQLAFQNIRGLFLGNAIEVFLLSLEGVSTRDIADKLALSDSTVRVLKKRVRDRMILEIKRLRDELE